MNYTKEEAKEIEKLKVEKINIEKTVEKYNDRVSKMRKDYTVYFELYGKKMKAVIMATSKEEAKQVISEKIIFHRVVLHKSDLNDVMEQFKDLFGGKI